MLSETECQMCPGGDEEGGCCTINLESFDFSCDVCENIGGDLECARVQCGLTDFGGYGCNGYGLPVACIRPVHLLRVSISKGLTQADS